LLTGTVQDRRRRALRSTMSGIAGCNRFNP
jgi:hypothetical protein